MYVIFQRNINNSDNNDRITLTFEKLKQTYATARVKEVIHIPCGSGYAYVGNVMFENYRDVEIFQAKE